jgi:hypothetical protein
VGMAATAGMVEATAITGLAMVILAMAFLGMVITTIAIISSLITAAGNGAPTARSMSAAIIDSRRRKETRPGREARASFLDSMMITVIVCLGPATNLVARPSACHHLGSPCCRQVHSRRLR